MNPSPAPALPAVPEPLQGLVDLALDVRWAWSHSADVLWRRLAPQAVGTHPQSLAYPADDRADEASGVRAGRRVRRLGPPPPRRARPDAECSLLVRGDLPEDAGRRARALPVAGSDRVFQHGVRPHRGAPYLQRRPRHPGRGLPESRQRSGRPVGRHRDPLAAGLLPAGAQRRAASRSSSTRSTTPGNSRSRPSATAGASG